MGKVMSIQQARYARDMDAFINTGMFTSPEIQARRKARREWDAMMAAQARKQKRELTEDTWKKREQELADQYQMESADLAASVVGAMTMTAGLLGLAMLL